MFILEFKCGTLFTAFWQDISTRLSQLIMKFYLHFVMTSSRQERSSIVRGKPEEIATVRFYAVLHWSHINLPKLAMTHMSCLAKESVLSGLNMVISDSIQPDLLAYEAVWIEVESFCTFDWKVNNAIASIGSVCCSLTLDAWEYTLSEMLNGWARKE